MASWRPDFAKFSWSSHSASKHRAWALLVNSMAFPARSHIERLGPENGGRRNDSIRPMSRNISYSPSTGPRFLKFSASEIADPTLRLIQMTRSAQPRAAEILRNSAGSSSEAQDGFRLSHQLKISKKAASRPPNPSSTLPTSPNPDPRVALRASATQNNSTPQRPETFQPLIPKGSTAPSGRARAPQPCHHTPLHTLQPHIIRPKPPSYVQTEDLHPHQ